MATQHPGVSHGDAWCHGNISQLDPSPFRGAEETVALRYDCHSDMYSTHTGLWGLCHSTHTQCKSSQHLRWVFFQFRQFCRSMVTADRRQGWHRDWHRLDQRCGTQRFALKSPGMNEGSQCCSLHRETSTRNHDCCESEWHQIYGTNLHAQSAALAPYWPVLMRKRWKQWKVKEGKIQQVCLFNHNVVEVCTW